MTTQPAALQRSPASRARAQAQWETRLLMRNGEQLLLTFAIPVGILLGLTVTDRFAPSDGSDRVATALAIVLTVSVLSAAFASLAIATGFERRSGALRFLGTTPLTRAELLSGKFGATALVTLLSAAMVGIVAAMLGWRPDGTVVWALPVLALGTAACAAWGMALAGLLRAEAVLAVANGLFLALLTFGGVVIPSTSLPEPLATLAPWLPSGAMVDGFNAALVDGTAPSGMSLLVLAAWLAVGATVASRTFRWS